MKKKSLILFGFLFLVVANVLAWSFIFDLNRPPFLKVVFFDVGQGDAIFIETFKKTQILIDGGASSKVVEKLAQELPFFDRQLDLMISTHPDHDHLGGLVEVLKAYQVDSVGWSGVDSQEAEFQEFKSEMEKDQARKIILKRGQKILVGKNLQFQVLAPVDDFEGKEVKDANTSSLVLRLVFGDSEFLFTGDTPKTVEKKLVGNNDFLESDVLKVSHHGSATSTTEEFLEMVKPAIAVIPVGKDNSYGHPSAEVLARLAKYNVRVLRTDEIGDIEMMSDGNIIKVNPPAGG